jgi:hypothetical protein
MIKSLFGEDGPPRPKAEKIEDETEDAIKRQLEELNVSTTAAAAAAEETAETQAFSSPLPPRHDYNSPVESDPEIEEAFSSIFRRPASSPPGSLADKSAGTSNNFPAGSDFSTANVVPASAAERPPVIEVDEELLQYPIEPFPVTRQQGDNVFQSNAEFNPPDAPDTTAAQMGIFPQSPAPKPSITVKSADSVNSIISSSSSGGNESNLFQTETKPLTTAETIRQSGMAWSAAVGLIGSIVFMMVIGWIFDQLTGAAPFGLVAGILIGGGIGFYQFFRVTSQIFK